MKRSAKPAEPRPIKSDAVFTLPKDKNGQVVSEDYLRRRFRLPSTTMVYRNLAIRFWYRSGMRVSEIKEQSICDSIQSPQTIYGILQSPAYKYMEEEYGLV